jgi:hypothetical protein
VVPEQATSKAPVPSVPLFFSEDEYFIVACMLLSRSWHDDSGSAPKRKGN